MNKKYKLAFFLLVTSLSSLNAVESIHSVRQIIDEGSKVEQKDVSAVDAFKGMFSDAKVVGQIRTMSAGYNHEEIGESNRYATALGGALKYELASLNGFNGAIGVLLSDDLPWATGKDEKHNDELSSSNSSYNMASEAYVNYKYDGLNIRAGRQLIDTPLADSDDIRMIANTFEGYVLNYEISKFNFFAAKIGKWQGIDAGLDDGWQKIGRHGMNIGGLSYESQSTYINTWVYNITNLTNALYIDGGIDLSISENLFIHGDIQYLNEKELDNSGIASTIYGAFIEFRYDNLSLGLAYNNANEHKGKVSFAGFGGGSLYTNMDTMIINEIAIDREAQAMVGGLVYEFEKVNVLYAIGNFVGDKNSLGIKEDILEQDMGFEYNYDDDFAFSGLYVVSQDLQNTNKTSYDWQRFQLMFTYDF